MRFRECASRAASSSISLRRCSSVKGARMLNHGSAGAATARKVAGLNPLPDFRVPHAFGDLEALSVHLDVRRARNLPGVAMLPNRELDSQLRTPRLLERGARLGPLVGGNKGGAPCADAILRANLRRQLIRAAALQRRS